MATAAGFEMGKAGVFVLEEREIKVLFQEFEAMRQWLKHVEAIHTLLWFLEVASDNGGPLVRLASQVHVCGRMRC